MLDTGERFEPFVEIMGRLYIRRFDGERLPAVLARREFRLTAGSDVPPSLFRQNRI